MSRYQSGYIYEASGAFFVRYYVTEIVDGTPRRVQSSYRLCEKDDKHHSRTCKAVKQLAADHMAEVNAQTTPTNNLSVADFWDKTYLPFAEENLRHSTVHGYKQIWSQHLKSHFGQMLLKEYKTPTGSVYLTSLAKTLGRATIQHIRSLASRHLQSRGQSRSYRIEPVARCQGARARRRLPVRRRTTRSKRLKTSFLRSSSMSIVS